MTSKSKHSKAGAGKHGLLCPEKQIDKAASSHGHRAQPSSAAKHNHAAATQAAKVHGRGMKARNDVEAPSNPSRNNAALGRSKASAQLDKATGKKRGTLFSAAPATPLAQRAPLAKGTAHAMPATQQSSDSLHGHNGATDTPAMAAGTTGKAEQASSKKRKRRQAKQTALIPELQPVAQAAPIALHDAEPTGRSNWEHLQSVIAEDGARQAAAAASAANAQQAYDTQNHDRERSGANNASKTPRKRTDTALKRLQQAHEAAAHALAAQGVAGGCIVAKGDRQDVTSTVALDCEMVGVGIEGVRNALARVCVVNDDGNVLLDVHVKPKERVTDFRTAVSGVRPADVRNGLALEDAMARTHALLQGRTVVGHALHNDFKVLMLQGCVSRANIRDTAVFPPLMTAPREGAKLRSRALRHLAASELGASIQTESHSPVDDARAALYIYHKYRDVWEAGLRAGLYRARGLRASGKIARGFKRQDAPRADAAQASAARRASQNGVLPHKNDSKDEEEFRVSSAAEVARMKAQMAAVTEST